MPRQSTAQKKKIEKVMHEYKHDDLKSGSGKKVTSKKQAVAIALHEAGASRDQKKSSGKK